MIIAHPRWVLLIPLMIGGLAAEAQVMSRQTHPVCEQVASLDNRGQLQRQVLTGKLPSRPGSFGAYLGYGNIIYSGNIDLDADGRVEEVYLYIDPLHAIKEVTLWTFDPKEQRGTSIALPEHAEPSVEPMRPVLVSIGGRIYVLVRVQGRLAYLAQVDSKREARVLCEFGRQQAAVSAAGRTHVMNEYDLFKRRAKEKDINVWMLAMQEESTETLRILISSRHPIDEISSDGLTALTWAVMRRRDDWVALLLKSGASTEVRGMIGTPLWYAIQKGTEESLRLLLKHGARTTGIGNVDPLEEAIISGRPAMLQILVDAGFKPTDQHVAHAQRARRESERMVSILTSAMRSKAR